MSHDKQVDPCSAPLLPAGPTKVAIVTGSSSGIGLATALALHDQGWTVVMACRQREKTAQIIEEVYRNAPQVSEDRLEFMHLDLSRFSSVQRFAKQFCEKYSKLNVLVNNAGLFMTNSGTTEDGFGETLQVNFLAHVLLTELLWPILKSTGGARVVHVSSLAHQFGNPDLYANQGSYHNSKLAQILYTYYCQRNRCCKHGVASIAVHPGVAATDIFRHLPQPFRGIVNFINRVMFLSPEQGASTSIFAAVDPSITDTAFAGQTLYLSPTKKYWLDFFTDGQAFGDFVGAVPFFSSSLSNDVDVAAKVIQDTLNRLSPYLTQEPAFSNSED